MKSTDEMILDLVAAGFVLPVHYASNRNATHRWFVDECESFEDGRNLSMLTDQQAHDLCAMEFARQIKVKDNAGKLTRSDPSDSTIANMQDVLGVGDSAAAIKALWEGVFDEG